MFNSGYPFQKMAIKKIQTDCHLKEHTYKFKNRYGSAYTVKVDEFCHTLFIIKFFLSNHKSYPHKFSYQLDTYDAPRVIRTSVDILLEIWQKEPDASFGFIGAPSIEKDGTFEDKIKTQRYRIYERLVANFFGEQHFSHAFNDQKSSYLLINNRCGDVASYHISVVDMFKKLYEGSEIFT